MGRYACYRLFCLAIPVLLTSICTVDVYINELVDYDDVRVSPMKGSLNSCFRHEPTEGRLVTRVLIGKDQTDPSLITSAPYLDVLSDGVTQYFKIENTDWSSSTPFIGNKYYYYRVKDSEIIPCTGLEYMEVYPDTFRRRSTLNIWWQQKAVSRIQTTEGRISIPEKDIFVDRVGVLKKTLWEYEKCKGIIFVKACNRRLHWQTVATLYFRDLNDNEIKSNYIIWPTPPTQLLPWKGYPKEYDVPDERLPCSFVSPRLEPISLTVNVTSCLTDTPLLKVRNYEQGETWVCVYITHPIAHMKRFLSPHFKQTFENDDIFMVTHTGSRSNFQIKALSYERVTTKLFVVDSKSLKDGLTEVTDPRVIVHSFPLYTGAEVDERMYTKRDITIGGVESVVYTARPHLAFSQVYHDGVPVFVEYGSNVIIEQFITQDLGVYVVVRGPNMYGHGRYLIRRSDNEWQRANDEHPDYIIV